MTVDVRGLDSPEQIEKWLLGLPLEPEMLQVCPEKSDVAASEGLIIFKWVQSITGIAQEAEQEQEKSHSDSQRCIEKFCKAVLSALPMSIESNRDDEVA